MGVVATGLVAEYVAKLANGTSQGSGSYSSWTDLIAGNNGALTSFDYSGTDGWAGAGTAGDPYCLISDGTSNVSIPSSVAMNPTGSFSWELWSYRSAALTESVYPIGNFDSNLGWAAWVDYNGGSPLWASRNAVSGNYVEIGGYYDPVTLGSWEHVICTYNLADSWQHLYVNGVDHGGSDQAVFVPRTGQPVHMFSGWSMNEFAGKIATFRMYNVALSQSDVSANLAAGVTAASSDGIWRGLTVIRDVHV